MRSKTKKSISRLLGIWTFILILIFNGIFPKPTYAFLSSLDACAANPECAAAVSSELSPAVSAPTGAGFGASTLSTTTEAGATTSSVQAVARVAVVAGTGISSVIAWHYWDQAQNEQAQNLAQQKYCSANPGDSVCNNYNTVVVHAFTQYYPNQPSDYSTPSCSVIGPVSSTSWNGVHLYVFGGNGAVEVIDTVDWNPWTEATIKSVAPCVSAWKDWPQEKRDAAVKLLNNSDWQGFITSMPEGGTLNPGDTIKAPTIVIPGTDGTKTQPGPYTIPDGYPNAVPTPSPSPSPDPSPSPSPDPLPSPSPSPSAPTASGGSPSPSPSPDPTPTSPPPSPEAEPQPDAGGANQGGNLNWNWKSRPTFGHTFNRHGEGSKNTKGLRGRAASEGKRQGQWLNNEEAARLLKDLKPNISQPTIVEIPEGLGQVIFPDGTIVPANHALVVPNAQSGGYTTAYPVVEPFPPTL